MYTQNNEIEVKLRALRGVMVHSIVRPKNAFCNVHKNVCKQPASIEKHGIIVAENTTKRSHTARKSR